MAASVHKASVPYYKKYVFSRVILCVNCQNSKELMMFEATIKAILTTNKLVSYKSDLFLFQDIFGGV